ncbi:MAG: hypothetical protein AAF533_05855 [Acidobacteriota bacterium]
MSSRLLLVLLLLAPLLTPSWLAARPDSVKVGPDESLPPFTLPTPPPKEMRREIQALERDLFQREVALRIDVPRTFDKHKLKKLIETPGGRLYQRADPNIAYEKLASVFLYEFRLRDAGNRMFVTVWAPSPRVGRTRLDLVMQHTPPVILELDPQRYGGVREALEAIVYLPGTKPTDEALRECLDRYPDHDEDLSQDRCSFGLFEEKALAKARARMEKRERRRSRRGAADSPEVKTAETR